MSNYAASVKVGPLTFPLITDGDVPAASELVYVLDGLNLEWEHPEDAPWPSQPNMSEGKLSLLTRDIANLAGVDRGAECLITVRTAPADTPTDFDTSIDGWGSSNATLARTTTVKKSGVAGMAMTVSSAGNGIANFGGLRAYPGFNYTASVAVLTPAFVRSCRVDLSFQDASGAQIAYRVGTAFNSNTAAWVTSPPLTTLAPAGTVTMKYWVTVIGATSGEYIAIDEATVTTADARTIGTFPGRIGELDAVPVRRPDPANPGGPPIQWIRFDLLLVDYNVDLAEAKLTLTRPANENMYTRLAAVASAAATAVGKPVNTITGSIPYVDALDVASESAYSLLVDLLRQNPWEATVTDQGDSGRPLLIPRISAVTGLLTSFDATRILSKYQTSWGPAVFALVGSVLKLNFAGAPPAAPGAFPFSLVIDAGRVSEDGTKYTRAKYADPDQINLSGPFGSLTLRSPYGNQRAAPVSRDITTNYVSLSAAQDFSYLYLDPEQGDIRWDVDELTWYPTDAELATLPFPLMPDLATPNLACYAAQVVITGIPNVVNPTGPTGYYAGSLAGVRLRVIEGKVVVQLKLSRRLPLDDGTVTALGITPANLATLFPTVKVNQVDPTLSVYDTRLVRKP